MGAGEYRHRLHIEKGEVDKSTRDHSIKNYATEHTLYAKAKVSDYDKTLDAQGIKYFRAYRFLTPFQSSLDNLSPRLRRINYEGRVISLHSIYDATLERKELIIKGYEEL